MPPRDLNIEYVSVVNERGEECAQQFDNSTGSLVGQPLRFPNASTRWTSATVRSREWRQARYTPSTAQPSSPLTPGPGQLLPLSREASEVNELRSDGRYSTPSQEGQVPGPGSDRQPEQSIRRSFHSAGSNVLSDRASASH